MTPRRRIAVVGSGLAGLTCAYELGANEDVTVFHDRDLLDSTSAVATAICHLYLVDAGSGFSLAWGCASEIAEIIAGNAVADSG